MVIQTRHWTLDVFSRSHGAVGFVERNMRDIVDEGENSEDEFLVGGGGSDAGSEFDDQKFDRDAIVHLNQLSSMRLNDHAFE